MLLSEIRLMACCVTDVLQRSVEAELQLKQTDRWMRGFVPIQTVVEGQPLTLPLPRKVLVSILANRLSPPGDVSSRTIMFMSCASTWKMLVEKVECVSNEVIDACPLIANSIQLPSSCPSKVTIFVVLGRHVNTVEMQRIDVDAVVREHFDGRLMEAALFVGDLLAQLSIGDFVELLNNDDFEMEIARPSSSPNR